MTQLLDHHAVGVDAGWIPTLGRRARDYRFDCVRAISMLSGSPIGAALSGPDTVAVSGPLAPSAPGQALATLMVTLGQAAAIRVSAAFSLLSTFRPQRIFTAAHSPT